MRVVWLNDNASFVGGAETYIYQSAQILFEKYNVENMLLYNTENRIDTHYAKAFSFTSVCTNIQEQLIHLNPDIIYIHQVASKKTLELVAELDIPSVYFVHDHKHFCLREHKYTTLGHKTCTKKVGAQCYSCLGFLKKEDVFPYIGIRSLALIQSFQDVLKKFSHIVVASEYMKEHLMLHAFEAHGITKIPLFSSSIALETTTQVRSYTKRFLFVGQLLRGKGIDLLLHAFAKVSLENTCLDICGSGKQEDDLRSLAKDLGIEHKVHFHGKVRPEELSTYYARAYAVVIPSRAPETFNLVGLEAMKHSKAVIASNVGGMREWLEDRVNGFVFDSNNIESLRKKLHYAIHNPKVISLMGAKGLEFFEEKFIAEIHCNTLFTLFETFQVKDTYAA